EDQMIPFSATTNVGRDELAAALASLVEQPAWRTPPVIAETNAAPEEEEEQS
ncbi:MAG: hypothetical protein JWL95_2116, partial [Gemmatimonadetes bacterium]|nr:hypothetical protein [Gemmatimonadota bacterium]